ncbi:MAG: glycosyltransferase family 4 protein [Desulfobulbaceae bacterium]|nr:glycosyltransferase family 4 protein [Desulfobulbaceae bacterium]
MFCPQFRPLVGGAERQAEKLAAALVKSGCRVTILTPRIDPDSPDKESVDGVTIERFPLINLALRYPIHGIALINIPYIIWQIFHMLKPRLVHVNVLHCHGVSVHVAGAALAGCLANVSVICKAATADTHSDLGKIAETGMSGRLVAWLARSLIGTWIATTFAVEEALLRVGVAPEKIVRIPNGVDLADVQKFRQDKGLVKRFLYLGRLSIGANRDVPTLVRAFDQIARNRPEIELAIVGGGDLLEETMRVVDTCEARGRIYAPGFDEPDKWLTWADCFVLPSRREGLSNALLEAMAVGLPCIANDIPPNREVLDGGVSGVLVPVGDVKSLSFEMLRLITEPGWATTLGDAARHRVEKVYAIETVASQYIDFYKKTLQVSSA